MGLSLRNITHKVWDQLNPFDNGRTWKNPQGNGRNQSVWQQATHSGLSNFVGHNIVEPVARAPINISAQLYQHAVAPALNLPRLRTGQVSLNPTEQAIGYKLGATGSLHQTLGDTAQLGLTLASGGLGNLIEKGTTSVLPDVAPAFVKSIAPKIASSSTQAGAFNAAATAGQGGNLKQTVVGGAEGAALGAALPVGFVGLKAGVKAVPKAAVAIKRAPGRIAAYQDSLDITPPEPSPTSVEHGQATPPKAVKVKAEPSPTPSVVKTTIAGAKPPKGAPVAKKIPSANSSVPEINRRINDVSAIYSKAGRFKGNAQDVVKQAIGQSQESARASYALRGSLEKHLTPEEQQAVSDILDGLSVKTTAKAKSVAAALKPLQEQAFQVRKVVTPNINRVSDYVTRLQAIGTGASVARAGRAASRIRNLSDIHDLRSAFSQERKVGKFVSTDGQALYGKATDLGLTDKGNNKFVAADGTKFKQTSVSKRELQAQGHGPYEHNIGRISGIYHADTASLKLKAEALKTLQKQPENYGLFTIDKAPQGAVPVTKIPELAGFYGSKADVSALEDAFGYKNPSGPVGKAYDALANTVTQFIVVNPFFHGMNQLFQAGIAAGNMPGKTTGWLKVAEGVFNVGEQDIKDYLGNGGHIPTYGANRENWLSHTTRGLTKVNSKAMSGIETRLRVGLYKASVDEGMSPKAAIDNIDRFLGDTKHVSKTVQRATLFAHYFKTMATAIGHQVAHPIEQKGSIANAAALAGVLAAVTYGYREFTGNKDAYVRVPGELGLAKEAVKSVNEIRKGELPSIAMNRINPVLKEGIQQTTNHDYFTQGNVSDTTPVNIGKVRLTPSETHALNALVAPAQVVERGAQGRRNLAETVGNQLGVYEPHAKGYQAAPKGPLGKVLNPPKALKGTGMEAQNAYFDGIKELKKSVSGDKKASSALAYYLAKNKDPSTGQTIQNTPSESLQNASALFANDKLRNEVQKFEKKQPSHDPYWDLSSDRLKTYMQYKEQFTGDAAKKFILQKNPWIKDVIAADEKYYNNLPKIPGSKPPISKSPKYPEFDKPTQALLDAYDKANADQKTELIKSHGPELSSAWNKVAVWTNQMRKAEGAPELKAYPVADKETQRILDYYNTLPKGTGARSAWIRANPGAYKKMTDYLTSASMNTLIKNAALDQFVGSEPSQELLKSIKNVGSYDIHQNADGTYTLGSGGSGSSSPYAFYKNGSGPDYKGVHALLQNNRVSLSKSLGKVRKAHYRQPSTHFSGGSKGVSKPKVSIKKSKV